ncbi:MAG: dihydroorotate dehydrogenase electron transfer subunit [Candidatus Riflebacteria bacterium]|nr:dihydroorotate dehydrogenase electron transfer subunit [Candidatus Riflebacteria bacterium]
MPETMQTWKISDIYQHSDTLKSFFLPVQLQANAGQFVMIWIPGVDEKPFAISGTNASGIEITVKAIGKFTNAMMQLKKNDWLGVRGPFGNTFQLSDNSIIVGGGCGNAPLKYLAQILKKNNFNFKWIAAAKTRDDIPFRNEMNEKEFWYPMTQDGSYGKSGIATEPLKEMLLQKKPSVIYGSGPEPMLLAVRQIAKEHQIPVQLSFERYMKCGIGICGQCCLDGNGIRLCIEGPILNEEAMAGVTEWGLPHRGPSGKRISV